MSSFAWRPCYVLAAAAVKVQDKLAALGHDCGLAGQNHLISGQRKTSDMDLLNHNCRRLHSH
jgi:hypothetical protein